MNHTEAWDWTRGQGIEVTDRSRVSRKRIADSACPAIARAWRCAARRTSGSAMASQPQKVCAIAPARNAERGRYSAPVAGHRVDRVAVSVNSQRGTRWQLPGGPMGRKLPASTSAIRRVGRLAAPRHDAVPGAVWLVLNPCEQVAAWRVWFVSEPDRRRGHEPSRLLPDTGAKISRRSARMVRLAGRHLGLRRR